MSNVDPDDEKCGNCKYFEKMELGECRKNAPRGGEGKAWSHVQAFEWCGEFEKTEDAAQANDLPNQKAKEPKSLEDVASGKEKIE